MKKLFLFVASLLFAATAFAQSYPTTTPTYIPSARTSATTLSAPGDKTFTINGLGAVGVEIRGTCTGLVAAVQGTVDGTTWTTLPILPVTAASTASLTSITAPGIWKVGVTALNKVRVHVTTLTASCTISMIGTPVSLYSAPQTTTTGFYLH